MRAVLYFSVVTLAVEECSAASCADALALVVAWESRAAVLSANQHACFLDAVQVKLKGLQRSVASLAVNVSDSLSPCKSLHGVISMLFILSMPSAIAPLCKSIGCALSQACTAVWCTRTHRQKARESYQSGACLLASWGAVDTLAAGLS